MVELSDNTLIAFHSHGDQTSLAVRLDMKNGAVWLNLNQIAQFF